MHLPVSDFLSWSFPPKLNFLEESIFTNGASFQYHLLLNLPQILNITFSQPGTGQCTATSYLLKFFSSVQETDLHPSQDELGVLLHVPTIHQISTESWAYYYHSPLILFWVISFPIFYTKFWVSLEQKKSPSLCFFFSSSSLSTCLPISQFLTQNVISGNVCWFNESKWPDLEIKHKTSFM